MRVLVLGGAGFIGYNLVRSLVGKGNEVTVWDPISEVLYPDSGRLSRISLVKGRNFSFLQQDAALLTHDSVRESDVIVNLAAIPGLTPSWYSFGEYFKHNTILVQHIASLAAESKVPLIQISTSSVYGSVAKPGAELLPNSPYGVSKLAAENVVRAFASEKGLSYSILRLFSVYGPNQRPDQFLGKIVRLLEQGKSVPITGDGSQSRSITYVDDVADAISRAIEAGPNSSTLDVCGNEEKTILEIVEMISSLMGTRAKLEFRPSRPGDQKSTVGNLLETKRLLNWEPRTQASVGLEKMVSSLTSGDL